MSRHALNGDDLLRPRIGKTSSLSSSSEKSCYETPELGDLQRLLWTPIPCHGNVNEVWPNLYIGDLNIARDIEQLRRMGITHVVNAAAGRFHIDTGAKFYKDLPVDYYGVEADDDPKFDLSIYFQPVAKYIRAALNSSRGDGTQIPRELILRSPSYPRTLSEQVAVMSFVTKIVDCKTTAVSF